MLYPNYDCVDNSVILVGFMMGGVGIMGCSWDVAGQYNTRMSQKGRWAFLFMGQLSLEGMESWCSWDVVAGLWNTKIVGLEEVTP